MQKDFWKNRRVFVTGGTGLVGSWLVKKLIELQADVIVLVRDWVPSSIILQKDFWNRITIVRGDLSDLSLLERILNEYEIQNIFHLAAQTIVTIANNNPLSTFESNIQGTWNLLEAARRVKNIASITAASSDKAYGDSKVLPYKEDMPLNAIYPYDVSKACTDMICMSYAKTFYLPVGITRCGNFFGGGDLNWNRIIPGTIRSIIMNEPPVIRSNGSLVRDYIYVEDAVDAYLSFSEQLVDNQKLYGEAFNFSNNTQKSTLEIVNMILEFMKSSIKPIVHNKDFGEIKEQYLDTTKAFQILGWSAQFGLAEGLQKTIAWYQEYFLREEIDKQFE